jgi:PUA domain protein
MGAIRFVTNGADIMRPGITDADPAITEGSFVVIGDVNHGKPLAIGIALYNGADLLAMEDGKVVKNLHFVGDRIWNLEI